MRRIFRRRREPLPPAGSTPDEAATRPMTVREERVTPGRRPPRLWPWLLALLLLVLAGIAAYALTRDDDDEDGAATMVTAAVPDVVGQRAEQATRRLAADGFQSRLAEAPSERPSRTVIRQRPSAGTPLARGSTVTLVVSEGPAKVAVPDVVGMSLPQAFQRVEAARLRPRAKRVFSPRPRGRVFRQRPAAGSELERNEVVLLTVSRGRARVAVPDLTGLREAEAARRLASAGLEANVVRVASTEPSGTVVAQNPLPGTRVATGSAVRVNVARGPSPPPPTTTTPTRATTTRTTTATATTTTGTASSAATVPDVVGLDEPTALRRLRQAGFTVRTVSQTTTDPAEDGVVLDQRPLGGTPSRSGAQVTITVGALAP